MFYILNYGNKTVMDSSEIKFGFTYQELLFLYTTSPVPLAAARLVT